MMQTQQIINGVQVERLGEMAGQLRRDGNLADFHFHVRNKWIDCGRNQTTVLEFNGMNESFKHAEDFVLTADEPPVLLGQDTGPNPVEYLLGALVSCLTSSMVYHAAVRGIKIDEIESSVEGDIDVRGFMGLSDEVRKGYRNITVAFRSNPTPRPKNWRSARGSRRSSTWSRTARM